MGKEKILGINTKFESKDIFEVKPSSRASFWDYDAVIIDSDNILVYYNSDRRYGNKNVLSEISSVDVQEDFTYLRKQIKEYVGNGKNVFVFIGTLEEVYVYTGQQTYSGTGKNRQTTHMVDLFNSYKFLPFDIKVTTCVGEEIDYQNNSNIVTQFLIENEDGYFYSAYFDCNYLLPVATIKGSNKIIGGIINCAKGHIILLPKPYYKTDYKNQTEGAKYVKKYLQNLISLDQNLKKEHEEALPQWVDSFTILDEKKLREEIANTQNKIDKLKTKIDERKDLLRKTEHYKGLLVYSSEKLENIVKEVLVELGFDLTKSPKNRSDIIAYYNNKGIVAEVKGVTKSAAEKHAAQLEKWVSEYIVENGESPYKAVLIVNAYCDKPLKDRGETFPNQMLKYCTNRSHCLISTTQLLCLYIECKQNPDVKDERIEELLTTTGLYERYKEYNNFICDIKND